MSMLRWTPFPEVDTFFNRMWPAGLLNRPLASMQGSAGKLQWAPPADISENDKEYLVRVELPAVRKEDVEVTFDDGMITVKGEREQQKEDKNERYHRTETLYGSFERQFSLPDNVNADAIRCESKDGILTVHIPKSETPKAKPIQITVQ
ncbi:MAG TPA: Hsp20/alpha crystallin family protein [Steroidobacteraceae bacterium]|nr:Hsp20/alpha crystallin family protein [Steroidobacteraceae bacterium]